MGNPDSLRPGDMISVDLLSGDLSIGAEGTVTEVDGKKIYAFGHHFLSVGQTELPFARAEVITLLPNLAASFKISTARQWMGTITQDRSTAIYGEIGRKAETVPISVTVKDGRRDPISYRMQMVNDRMLTPFIVQMAIYSAMDATERTSGSRRVTPCAARWSSRPVFRRSGWTTRMPAISMFRCRLRAVWRLRWLT